MLNFPVFLPQRISVEILYWNICMQKCPSSHFYWNLPLTTILNENFLIKTPWNIFPSIKKLIFQSHRWGRGRHDFFNGHFEALLRPLWALYGFSHGHEQYLHENDDGLNSLKISSLKSSLSCLITIGNKIWNDDNKFSVTTKPSTTLKTANFGKMCSWGNKQNQEIHKTLFARYHRRS